MSRFLAAGLVGAFLMPSVALCQPRDHMFEAFLAPSRTDEIVFVLDTGTVIRRDLVPLSARDAGVEIFNPFNNVVFGGINTNITNANFGRVSSQTNTRVAQLKIRVEF